MALYFLRKYFDENYLQNKKYNLRSLDKMKITKVGNEFLTIPYKVMGMVDCHKAEDGDLSHVTGQN